MGFRHNSGFLQSGTDADYLKEASSRPSLEDESKLPRSSSPPKTAVVLSGGEGVRLRPITNDIPKGLVKVGGKPLLQWVIEWLRDNGVSNIVIGVAYLKDQIMDFVGDGHRFGVDIRYSVHTVQGGTGEGFRLAISRYVEDQAFFALNGDQIVDIDLRSMSRKHIENKALATIAVVHPRLPFGLVKVDDQDLCQGFAEKPIMRDLFCSSGIYVFEREIATLLPNQGDVERTTFPLLARRKKVGVYRHKGSFITVNSVRELEEAEEQLEKSIPK